MTSNNYNLYDLLNVLGTTKPSYIGKKLIVEIK